MSFVSFFNSEVKYRPEWEWTRELVIPVLEVIGEQGHSGGSMSVFYPFLKKWINSEEPIAVEEQDMIYPIYLIIKDYDKEQLKVVAEVISRTIGFKSFTPIEDLPDQWIQHAEDSFQHKRCGAMFKSSSTGKPYYLDAIMVYEPDMTFSDWMGYPKRAEVVFPFEEYTFEPKRIFYTDTNRTTVVKEDPQQWLSQRGQSFLLGFDPRTSKAMQHHFICKSEEDADEIIRVAQEQIELLKPRLKSLTDLDDFNYRLSFEFHSFNEPGMLKELTLYKCHKGKVSYLVENVIRLIAEYSLRCKEDDSIEMVVKPVFYPGKHHQQWEPSSDVHVGFKGAKDFLYDKGTIVSPLKSKKYLYVYCKDNGLKYKGPRQ